MNYLAHAYLSFGKAEPLVGNMISDYVKGKKKFDYPPGIQAGITLHRQIDAFTDAHPATKQVAALFKPVYRLYSGAFADIVYDYFLANDKAIFAEEKALLKFSVHTYATLEPYKTYFPPAFAAMFPYMQSQNWLYNYQYDSGIQKSFAGLARRAAYLQDTGIAYDIFLKNKPFFNEQYHLFFDSVKNFAAATLEQLLKH